MNTLFEALAQGLGMLVDPVTIVLIVVGVIWGIVAGALPGISATIAVGSVVAFTFSMDTAQAIAFLVSVLVGTQFGNSVPAILIGVPGTPAAVLVATEGYKLHQRGRTSEAMAASLMSSVIGQFVSVLLFAIAVVPLSHASTTFLAPEVFAVCLLGMTSIVSLGGRNIFKGVIAAAFGLVVAMVGRDPVTSIARLSFGDSDLSVGLNTIAVIIGLLAIGELIRTSRQVYSWRMNGSGATRLPPLDRLRGLVRPIVIGTGIGSVIGALPGASSDVASYMSYQQAKIFSRHRKEFGKGSMEAVAAIDSAQNAAIGTGLIPTIGMGIPGGATMVIILATLTLHGLVPGPLLVQQSADVLYSGIAGLLGGTVVLALVGWPMAKLWMRMARVDRPIVVIWALALSVIGVFAINRRLFDVVVMTAFGLIGYFMLRYGYPVAAAALGVVLGGLIESSLRQGLVLTGGWGGLVARPVTAVLLGLNALLLGYGIVAEVRRQRADRRDELVEVGVGSE